MTPVGWLKACSDSLDSLLRDLKVTLVALVFEQQRSHRRCAVLTNCIPGPLILT